MCDHRQKQYCRKADGGSFCSEKNATVTVAHSKNEKDLKSIAQKGGYLDCSDR